MKKAIFLDRDGVINMDRTDYVKDIDEVQIIPDITDNLNSLKEMGFLLVIISNQSAVGRNIISDKKLDEINNHILAELQSKGVKIDDVYYCPHTPSDDCSCRKPEPGLLLQAAKRHNIDLESSWMIGDKTSDIDAGKKAGCKTYQTVTNSSISDAVNFIRNSPRD